MIRLAVLVALALGTPSLAYLHETLKRAEPAPGATLSTVPRELRLTFTRAPEIATTHIELLALDSQPVALAPLRLDTAHTVVAQIRGTLVAGTYAVVWRIAGRDGHPVRGHYSFTIAPGAEGLVAMPTTTEPRGEPGGRVAAPGQAPPPAEHHDPASTAQDHGFDAESPAYVAVRWLTFTGLLIILGAIAFNRLVLGSLRRQGPPAREVALVQPASARAASLGLAGAVILGVMALARLYAQSYAMHGAGEATNPGLLGTMLTSTVWGWGWLLQVAAAAAAIAGFVTARRRRAGGWTLATLGAIALAFTPALSGHAASAPRLTGFAILSDGLHVMGAGGWLGSLLAVLIIGIPAALRLPQPERGRAVADIVNAFSPTALAFAGLSGVTGLFTGWLHVGSLGALWQTQYGQTLLLKLAVLSVVAATGAYNWRRVRPALGDLAGAARIRRSASAELAVGALVLLVTAVLVATPTPMDLTAMTE